MMDIILMCLENRSEDERERRELQVSKEKVVKFFGGFEEQSKARDGES